MNKLLPLVALFQDSKQAEIAPALFFPLIAGEVEFNATAPIASLVLTMAAVAFTHQLPVLEIRVRSPEFVASFNEIKQLFA